MWQQWLPNCREYRLSGCHCVEMYAPFLEEDPDNSYVELWLPVEKV
jgi:predicted transcriptional regulator YdeE